jgi:hypothetical protein
MASMLLTSLVAAAEGGEEATKLPVDPLVIGIGALAFFFVLLGITWAFRNTSHKH